MQCVAAGIHQEATFRPFFNIFALSSYGVPWMSIFELVANPVKSSSDSSSSSPTSSKASSDSSSSTELESNEPESSSCSTDELQRLRNFHRTAAARAARQKQVASKGSKKELKTHPADDFRQDLLSQRLTMAGQTHMERRRRVRFLYSWLMAFAGAIHRFFTQQNVQHLINVAIIDDTNVRLSAPSDQNSPSRVISVMNVVQSLVCKLRSPCNGWAWQNFLINAPLTPLQRSNTSGLATEFLSWLFLYLGKVGERYSRLGISEHVSRAVPIQALVICWDSLKTNNAVLKGLRNILHKFHARENSDGPRTLHPLLSCRCSLHQVALCRKQIVFYFGGHWSAIVRLAHLFESHSFRLQFQKALMHEVISSFDWIQVLELPRDHCLWEAQRRELMTSADRHYSVTRLRQHRELMLLDNGDPSSTRIVHWCTGVTCSCKGNKKTALIKVCHLYNALFASGFPVPLTYRWLHAHRALEFTKDRTFVSRFQSRCVPVAV